MDYFDGFNPKFLADGDKLFERVVEALSKKTDPEEVKKSLDEHCYEISDNLLRDLNYDCKMVGFRLVCFLANILTKVLMPLNDNKANEEGAFRWIMDAIGQLKYENTLDMSVVAELLSKQLRETGDDEHYTEETGN
jgi:hypothetical protein